MNSNKTDRQTERNANKDMNNINKEQQEEDITSEEVRAVKRVKSNKQININKQMKAVKDGKIRTSHEEL